MRFTGNMAWSHVVSMAMQQEPIDWRYLPYTRPIFQAYVREYHHKIALFGTVPPFWDLEIAMDSVI